MEAVPSPAWTRNRLGWLGLAWFEGFGSRSLRRLHVRFHADGDAAYHADGAELIAAGIVEKSAERFVAWRARTDADAFARRLDAEQIRLILTGDAEYPRLLAASADPPGALFVRGASLAGHRQPVAIVGTRVMTSYGSRVTREISGILAQAGCEIISGLAIGIDAEAHRACLEAGGRTVAVLAGGANNAAISPRSNARLAADILKTNGSVISEFPPGTESLKHHFPLRNRIIAALAHATIVIEAAEASGSLITATCALDDNRDVFAVPGPITSPQSAGTNALIVNGAIPCTGAECVLRHLGATVPRIPTEPLPETLTEQESTLLELLSIPRHLDELVRAMTGGTRTVLPLVTNLELKGLIELDPADIVTLTRRGRQATKRTSHPEESATKDLQIGQTVHPI